MERRLVVELVVELVGNYLLYELSKFYKKKDIGLYGDDGLAIFKNKSGPESKKLKHQFNLYSGRTS